MVFGKFIELYNYHHNPVFRHFYGTEKLQAVMSKKKKVQILLPSFSVSFTTDNSFNLPKP